MSHKIPPFRVIISSFLPLTPNYNFFLKKPLLSQKGPEILTTGRILLERERAMCPRFGDAYARTERADIVKDEVAFYRIKKAVDKKLDCIDLAGCRWVGRGASDGPSVARPWEEREFTSCHATSYYFFAYSHTIN